VERRTKSDARFTVARPGPNLREEANTRTVDAKIKKLNPSKRGGEKKLEAVPHNVGVGKIKGKSSE